MVLIENMSQDPDATQSPKQPGNIASIGQSKSTLCTNPAMLIDISFTDVTNCQNSVQQALGETELADIKIRLKNRELQEMELDLEIKRRTLRKLDLEIQKLEEK